jgi:hypothetical protein
VTRLALTTTLALLLVGCGAGTPPSRFYLLDPATPPGDPAPAAGPRVLVDRPTVARHLDRPQLVRRLGPHEIAVTEFETWAEPLDDLLTRALVDALAARFGRDRVQATPSRRDAPADARLSLDVLRFDTDPADEVVLDARWTLLAGADERFAGTGRERITEPVPEPVTPEARVAASARAVQRLVEVLAPAVERAARRR